MSREAVWKVWSCCRALRDTIAVDLGEGQVSGRYQRLCSAAMSAAEELMAEQEADTDTNSGTGFDSAEIGDPLAAKRLREDDTG